VNITFGDVVVPAGTSPNDEVAHAETLKRVLQFDIGAGRTAVESLADKRIALAAGAG
jgi:hypothetical protein